MFVAPCATLCPVIHKRKQLGDFFFAEGGSCRALHALGGEFGHWHPFADVAAFHCGGNQAVPRTGEVVEGAGFGLACHLPVPPQLKFTHVGVRQLLQHLVSKIRDEVFLNTGDIGVAGSPAFAAVYLPPQFEQGDRRDLCDRVCPVC